MGLPGSGKTTLANALVQKLRSREMTVDWFNADDVRSKFNDWDFSEAGRIRQSFRMRELADMQSTDFVICDFVAPLAIMRSNFKADWIVWLDTIVRGRFEDTNSIFVKPLEFDFRVTEQDCNKWSNIICNEILSK